MVGRLSKKMEQMENSQECTLDEWVHMAAEYSTEVKRIVRLCHVCWRVHQVFFITATLISAVGIVLLLRFHQEFTDSINTPVLPRIIFCILFPFIVQLLLGIFDIFLIRLSRIDSGKLPTNVRTTLPKLRYVEVCLRPNSFPVLDWEDDGQRVIKIISGFIFFCLLIACIPREILDSLHWMILLFLMILGGFLGAHIFLKLSKVAFQPCQRIIRFLFKENEVTELNDRCHSLLEQNDKNYWRNHLSNQERQKREMEEQEGIKKEQQEEQRRKEEEQREKEERAFWAYRRSMEFNAESYIRENDLHSYISGMVSWEDQKKVENDPALTPEQKKEVIDVLQRRAIMYY